MCFFLPSYNALTADDDRVAGRLLPNHTTLADVKLADADAKKKLPARRARSKPGVLTVLYRRVDPAGKG